jgi:hypothetical protein
VGRSQRLAIEDYGGLTDGSVALFVIVVDVDVVVVVAKFEFEDCCCCCSFAAELVSGGVSTWPRPWGGLWTWRGLGDTIADIITILLCASCSSANAVETGAVKALVEERAEEISRKWETGSWLRPSGRRR